VRWWRCSATAVSTKRRRSALLKNRYLVPAMRMTLSGSGGSGKVRAPFQVVDRDVVGGQGLVVERDQQPVEEGVLAGLVPDRDAVSGDC
jgi:hypothetical protein